MVALTKTNSIKRKPKTFILSDEALEANANERGTRSRTNGRRGRPTNWQWNEWLLVYAERIDPKTAMGTLLKRLCPVVQGRSVHIRTQSTREQFINMCRAQVEDFENDIALRDAANELWRVFSKAKNHLTNHTAARRNRINRALFQRSRDYGLEPELNDILRRNGKVLHYHTDLIRRYFSFFGLTLPDRVSPSKQAAARAAQGAGPAANGNGVG